jgi:hypothetical protein
MSLDRVDARTKLDPDVHEQLIAICDIDGVTIAEFIERLLVPVVEARVRDARLLVEKIDGGGKNREKPGIAGSGRR